jgi:hypothetical protein
MWVHRYQVDSGDHNDADRCKDYQPVDERGIASTDLPSSPHVDDPRFQGVDERRNHERHRSGHEQHGEDIVQVAAPLARRLTLSPVRLSSAPRPWAPALPACARARSAIGAGCARPGWTLIGHPRPQRVAARLSRRQQPGSRAAHPWPCSTLSYIVVDVVGDCMQMSSVPQQRSDRTGW